MCIWLNLGQVCCFIIICYIHHTNIHVYVRYNIRVCDANSVNEPESLTTVLVVCALFYPIFKAYYMYIHMLYN